MLAQWIYETKKKRKVIELSGVDMTLSQSKNWALKYETLLRRNSIDTFAHDDL